MAQPRQPEFKRAWQILKAVDRELSSEKDSKGQVKATGEGRALCRMQNQLMAAISRDATQFLKSNGFTGGGMKAKPARSGR